MNNKITPSLLSNYWEEQHINKDDVIIALKHIDQIASTLPVADIDTVPTIIHMIGAPGSGKTTLVENLLQQPEINNRNFFHLGFDRVMESLPAYHESLEKIGAPRSFQQWELPARISGYALLERLIQSRASLIFDHSASDSRHIELLKNIRDTYGYRVIMIHSKTSFETALERVGERNQKGARFTSREMIIERHGVLLNLVDNYKKHFTVLEIENDNQLENGQIKHLLTYLTNLD